ncbi:DNA-binding protein [Ottowia sp.]|uniref:DNA-binding protein n=1 Tax=Ottowia sp. TaxID=1898956 RepID=UPI002D0E4A31|nr:DNA-binding protein [Ottowia sp.]HRN74305.1 DNA-binding protein [Ottowia sp.]HRQ01335.1 DNA-binding protein [Ottowia sp.]
MSSQNLQNLQAIGRLKVHQPTPDELRRLLAAAERNLKDAGVDAISDETRFDAAYKAIMQCALVGMMASGYRPSTSEPGHHQTLIQALGQTLGVKPESWVVLDALRRRRNANDYTGDGVTPDMVAECVAQAVALLRLARAKVGAR